MIHQRDDGDNRERIYSLCQIRPIQITTEANGPIHPLINVRRSKNNKLSFIQILSALQFIVHSIHISGGIYQIKS
jgi:hypothetical protein